MEPVDHDLALALQLQEQFDREPDQSQTSSFQQPQTELSPVDPQWETLDPHPDIRALFLQFNERFFWGRLAGIEVKWSPRMTLCAGLCCYEGRGGLCSVRLSLPLLKLRPRKDLVETLLHEMIHAYLFVTDNNKDHDGHGPEFHKHMYRINAAIGSNISVYHTFHDEVAEYRQHWWRCDGPCQNRKPYYGYVKRAMNRAPSERDPWFKDHQNSCNGTFIKIKEPENYGKKKGKDKEDKKNNKDENDKNKDKNKNMDIRIFAGKGHSLTGSSSTKDTNSGQSPNTGTSSNKENVMKNHVNDKEINNYKRTTTDSDSDTDLKTCKSVSSGSMADADRKAGKKKPFVKFYSTDSDDEIPVSSFGTSKDMFMTDPQRTSSVMGNNATQSSIPVDTSAVILSDSEDELFANLEIPQVDKDEQICNKNSENTSDKQVVEKPLNQESLSYLHSADSNIDVRLKLREVWGKKNDVFQQNKINSKKKKSSIHSNPINDSALPSMKRPSVKHKRLSDDEQIPECSKKAKLSGASDSYSYTKIEDVFRRMKSPDKADKPSGTSDSAMHHPPPVQSSSNGSVMHHPQPVQSSTHHTCPVCNESVPAVDINAHLDLCLTTS